MRKPVIAVDIDDVLAANAEGFVAYSNNRWNTNLTVEDYHEHWSELWKVDHQETNRRAIELHASGVMGTYQHHPEAVDVLHELAKRYRLIIATSRRVSVKNETERWISTHFPNTFEAVYFAGIYDKPIVDGSFSASKLEVLKKYKANYLIDDQLKHCMAAASVGLNAVLFGNYSWNQADSLQQGITRAKDWPAVLEYFDGRR